MAVVCQRVSKGDVDGFLNVYCYFLLFYCCPKYYLCIFVPCRNRYDAFVLVAAIIYRMFNVKLSLFLYVKII